MIFTRPLYILTDNRHRPLLILRPCRVGSMKAVHSSIFLVDVCYRKTHSHSPSLFHSQVSYPIVSSDELVIVSPAGGWKRVPGHQSRQGQR